MIEYKPTLRTIPPKTVDVPTAWAEVSVIIEDLLDRFCPKRESMLEFGVDYAYSTAVFANFFEKVHGVDHFKGDINAGERGSDLYDRVQDVLRPFPNITLYPMSFQEFTRVCRSEFDLIHVDIVHNYEETFECGEWAIAHSPVTMFHDTLAFPEVMKAVTDLAAKHNLTFYNVPEKHGVGILVKE